MGGLGSGPRCGIDGLGQYKIHVTDHSVLDGHPFIKEGCILSCVAGASEEEPVGPRRSECYLLVDHVQGASHVNWLILPITQCKNHFSHEIMLLLSFGCSIYKKCTILVQLCTEIAHFARHHARQKSRCFNDPCFLCLFWFWTSIAFMLLAWDLNL